MKGKTYTLLIASLPLLLAACSQVQVSPTDMAIEYQFLESSDEIYEACGRRAEACARVVGKNCIVTLPKTHWDQHLVHEMRHCFGSVHAPTVAVSDW